MSDVREFPPQEKVVEPEQMTSEQLMKIYQSAVAVLTKMQVPFVLLAPMSAAGSTGIISNMNQDYITLTIARAFLNQGVIPQSATVHTVETGAAN